MAKKSIENRKNARSRSVGTAEFKELMSKNWDKQPALGRGLGADFIPEKHFASLRRAKLSEAFLGDRLIIEAGYPKTRSNDTDYRFRPNTTFIHLTGLGVDFEPGAVLVFDPITIRTKGAKPHHTHICTLYIDPLKGYDSTEFYTSPSRGEFWIGQRPSLADFEEATGIKVKDKAQMKQDLKKPILPPHKTRTISQTKTNNKLLEFTSEMRLVKDSYEIDQMRKAIGATKDGFVRVLRNLSHAKTAKRGERIIEGEFFANAIEQGNSLGYETIAAAGEHATTLHWINNNGEVKDGELLLLDAGVELDSLYTADITRTFPINGSFNKWQRDIYQLVLNAADAAFLIAKPGVKFRDIHDKAMEVIAQGLIDLGILKVSLEEALSKKGQQHRRWMCHGTSHHLGIDVHDCAYAREQEYKNGVLKPGMIFTIEPGLYFKSNDLLVPAQYRGIGVRIEDDILITETGAENLSIGIPRAAEHLEAWMKELVHGG
ncbi:Xaa-Pro aminopeptidase [Actinomycetota bacterium]|nr:Xaa-Pro aminopeptidase [Actinomycetota bacterium]